jgi:tetratricopeptide (TPR) repeat protein
MRKVLIVGGAPHARAQAVRRYLPDSHTALVVDAATMPFVRARDFAWPPPSRVVVIEDIEKAFPDCQSGGTRLVLTQSTYLLQTWIDRLDVHDLIVATANRAALESRAPEALQRRGAWGDFEIVDLERKTVDTKDTKGNTCSAKTSAERPSTQILAQAYAVSDSADRLALCREAVSLAPDSPVAWLALASACRETKDGAAACEALDRATALAPDWEASAYESGKLSLVYDDTARARDAFQRAADLMPTFSAAFANLGATLGELGDPEAALAAFSQALTHDPRSFTILNNIGVVCRDLGRLEESEAAFRRVIAINPAFVFGHYNLGHTLFLAGKYPAALDAYEEGQRRDPQRNRRQGCRLAVVRFANGDTAGAERDLWTFANAAPPDEREDLLLEAYEIAHALLEGNPDLEPQRPFLDRLGSEIAKSE